jgi:hypothetical protein
LFQAVRKFTPQNLRGDLLDRLPGMFGGRQPSAIPAGNQSQDVFDGAAQFGGVIELRGVTFF